MRWTALQGWRAPRTPLLFTQSASPGQKKQFVRLNLVGPSSSWQHVQLPTKLAGGPRVPVRSHVTFVPYVSSSIGPPAHLRCACAVVQTRHSRSDPQP
eukprot:7190195-Prymnesium_polylepis.2